MCRTSAASLAHSGGYNLDPVPPQALVTSTTIGLFSVVSTEDDSETEDSDIKREPQRLGEKHLKEISELQAHQCREV